TQHTASLPIPYEAAIGFAHCGWGFYHTLKYLGQHKLESVSYPRHLVINDRSARPPENRNEQLFHFIFHLRRIMAWMAEHPIGQSTTPSQATVAQWISTLPSAPFLKGSRQNDDEGAGVVAVGGPRPRDGPGH